LPLFVTATSSPCPCVMADVQPTSLSKHKLVGQTLLYSISIFASLGVFLVRHHPFMTTQLSDYLLVVWIWPRVGCLIDCSARRAHISSLVSWAASSQVPTSRTILINQQIYKLESWSPC
jgi:hypothetical protein